MPIYQNYIQNQYQLNTPKKLHLVHSQKNLINNNSNYNLNTFNQFRELPLNLNIPTLNQNFNYTVRTPSPSPNRKNIIDLSNNQRFKRSLKSLNSQVVYRKLKGIEPLNDSPKMDERIISNISQFPLNNRTINNNNSSGLLYNSNPPIYKTMKKRKIIINSKYFRNLSYDINNYNHNVFNTENSLGNQNRNINSIKNNPLNHLINNNNNNLLRNNNNLNQNTNHNKINNNYGNYQNNLNIKMFNSLLKQNYNHQNNINITIFNGNNQNKIYQESFDNTANNQENNYNNNKDSTKNNFTDSNNITNNINDISKANNSMQNQQYNNSIDLSKNKVNSNIYSIEITNDNDKSKIISRNNKKINISAIYYNTVQNIQPNINIQQNHINIIQIPKNKIHHFEENGIFIKANNELSQTKIVPNDDFAPSEFKIIKQIGVGGFGKIYSVKWIKNGEIYALKKLNLKKNELHIFQNKTNIFKDLVNKTGINGVVRIYGDKYIQLENSEQYNYYIIMELGERDWLKELQMREPCLLYYSEKELFEIIVQLVKTLAIMQKNKVTHRDIKPQNILLCKGIFKLCDFGESKLLKGNGKVYQHIRGSELYMSPIIFNALNRKETNVLHNTYKSDVFSLGMCILLAASFSRKLLCDIKEIKDMNIISKIVNNALKKRYSEKIINLILSMLQLEENLRFDFIELEKYISTNWPS